MERIVARRLTRHLEDREIRRGREVEVVKMQAGKCSCSCIAMCMAEDSRVKNKF